MCDCRHVGNSIKDSRSEMSAGSLSRHYLNENSGGMGERGSVGEKNPLLSKSYLERQNRMSDSGPLLSKNYSFQGADQRQSHATIRPFTQSFKDGII